VCVGARVRVRAVSLIWKRTFAVWCNGGWSWQKKKIVAATTELSKTTCTEDNLTGSISESLWDENIFSTPCKMVDKMLSDALLLPWGEIKCLCITLNNGFLSFLLFSGTDLFLTVKKQQQKNKNNKKKTDGAGHSSVYPNDHSVLL